MVDAISTNTATARIDAGSTMLASNFETFLSLLTAQLRNQDPLSPVDSNQFTSQLTQMAGVEQQLLTNDLLKGLLAAQQGGGLAGAANYIGKDATAAWSAVKLENGQASWSYELGASASSATLQVLDSAGRVVWSGDAPQRTVGVHDFTWNGKTAARGDAPDGVYTLRISAKTGADQPVDAQVLVRGRITGVELYNGEPYATIGGSVLPLSSLIALDEARAAPAPEADDPSLLNAVASALNPLKLLS